MFVIDVFNQFRRCADGYMGPRCEYKNLDGSYLRKCPLILIILTNRCLICAFSLSPLFQTATRPRVMLETASIASGAVVALLLGIIFLIVCCLRRQRKLKELEQNGDGMCDVNGGSTATGIDTVDGFRTYAATTAMISQQQPASLHPSQYYPGGDNDRRTTRGALAQKKRPFGSHHHHTIPMSEALKR